MKICFFGDTAAHHLLRWAKYYIDKGHEVHVVTFNSRVIGHYDNIQVHFVRKKLPGSGLSLRIMNTIPMILSLKKLIREINPDILHSHSAGGYAWMVMFTGFHPFVVTPWGSDVLIDIQKSRTERFFTKFALRKADIITCDGENTIEAITNLGISPKKIRFITFGVDIKKFKPSWGKEEIRKKLCLSDSKIAVSTRFLTPVHDVETLVRAVPAVLQKVSDAKLIIIGDGSQKEYLINLAKSLGAASAIDFVGRVSQDEMILRLQSADIYISTSLSESGLAASTAEAMACGLPVINTDTGDIKLWIKNGQGGSIIPTKNPEVLAEKIICLLKNDEERMKFGKTNRKIIEQRNNYYVEMEKMEEIYKKVIRNRQVMKNLKTN